MSNELVIPPDIRPESPVRVEPVDDLTVPFAPRFARGMVQRNSYGDPRWRFGHRYRGLRQADSARMHATVSEAQGAYRAVMVSPGQSNRGSFATTYSSELFTNSDFSSVSGWSAETDWSLSVSNGVLRAAVAGSAVNGKRVATQSVSYTQYAPYVARGCVLAGRGPFANMYMMVDDTALTVFNAQGYQAQAYVPLDTGGHAGLYHSNNADGFMAGDYLLVPFMSASRCFLIDGGGNSVLQSQTFDNASWTKSGATITANGATAPDGSATADIIIDSSLTQHHASQVVTVPTAAADFSFSLSVAPGARSWVSLQMVESTGSHTATVYADVTNGTLGTSSTSGANWTNVRTHIKSQGGGWYRVTITARKASAATTVTVFAVIAEADNDVTFAATSGNALSIWGAAFTQSSVPVRYVATTSATVAAVSQSSAGMYVKGLPASQTDLLVPGDWIEIDGQLKRVIASLNSDAAGLGYLQFRPRTHRAVADNTPIIVTKPMGRFLITSAPMDSMYGLNSDYELVLDEVYE